MDDHTLPSARDVPRDYSLDVKDEPVEYDPVPGEVEEITADEFAGKKSPKGKTPPGKKINGNDQKAGGRPSPNGQTKDQNNNREKTPTSETDSEDQESLPVGPVTAEPTQGVGEKFKEMSKKLSSLVPFGHAPNRRLPAAKPTLYSADHHETSKTGKIFWLVIPFLVSLLAFICIWSSVLSKPQHSAPKTLLFSQLLKNLQTGFSNQPKHFWTNIIASYENSIVENRDPSIILLVHDETRAQNVSLFTQALVGGIDQLASSSRSVRDVESISFDLNVGHIAASIESGDDDRVKLLLDEKLESVYKPGKRIALLKNVQQLPGKPALLFFTYGDDESTCKFKGIILVMTVEVKSGQIENYQQLVSNERDLNSFTQKYLIDLWRKSLNVDSQIKPLLTRIANNVLIFN